MKYWLIGIDCQLCGCAAEYVIVAKNEESAGYIAQEIAYSELSGEADDEWSEEDLEIEGWVLGPLTKEQADSGEWEWQ
jgi:hypothetical protein